MAEQLRVLAVDDEPPALDELSYLLGRHPDIGEVVAVSDATAALREIARAVVRQLHVFGSMQQAPGHGRVEWMVRVGE